MKYNNHLNYKKRKRFLLKVRIALLILLCVFIAAGYLFYVKYVKEDNTNTADKTTSEVTTSTVASSINVFRSPFFQFQANKNWAEVPNESNDRKFVYRSLRSNLIEHELVIYVGQIPANLEANRVLPSVLINNKSELDPESVSDHCVKANNNQSKIQAFELTVSSVKMLCDSDSTNYTVLVGEKNGDTVLNMIRPDGAPEAYAIYYTNLRATPNDTEIRDIVDSFQTR